MPFKTFGVETLTSSDVNSYLMTQCVINCTSTTRPVSPSDGWFIYETDTQRRMLYSDSAWKQSGIYEETKIKTKDSVQQSWGTMYQEDELPLTLLPNSNYWIDGFIQMSQQGTFAAGDPKGGMGAYWPVGSNVAISLNCPVGDVNQDNCALRVQTMFNGDAGVSLTLEDGSPGLLFQFASWINAVGIVADIDMTVRTGNTGGKLGLMFAGAYLPTSGSLNDYDQVKSKVHANSWLRSRKLS